MVDFENETRKRCRHCKMRLPEPTSNEREAFCTPGCYRSFYLHRCRVCEEPIEQKRDGRRMLCKRAKCRNAFSRNFVGGRYLPSSAPSYASKTLDFIGSKEATKPDRAWRIVAGPELTPSQLHCATVPDGPDCKWEGGSYERIEAQNRRLLKAHVAELGEKAIIQRQHMPLNIQGGYRPMYRLLKHKDGSDACRAPDPVIPGMGYDRQSAETPSIDGISAALIATIPNDLSIPPFLDRRPWTELQLAA
jgi:hypothetical protein